jgi:putative transposase
MINVGLDFHEREAVTLATLPNQPPGFGGHIIGQDFPTILGNPYRMIANKIVCITCFTGLQAIHNRSILYRMETVHILRLDQLPRSLTSRLRAAQEEAARVWNECVRIHQEARTARTRWPNRDDLQTATRGMFALHSQTVQMICHAFLATVETARQLKKTNPRMRYPYKEKHFYPLLWPAQAVTVQAGRVVLPMGRGRQSVVFKVAVPEGAGACKLVWNAGYELHVTVSQAPEEAAPGVVQATVDLGEVHQAAVTTNTGAALVVSGRKIRSIKRHRHRQLGQIATKRQKCQKGSRRWRKLQWARAKVSAQAERQIRDLRHKGTRAVVDFCVKQEVGTVLVGNPDGVRTRRSGRHHNQRMSGWEYGRDIDCLTHKCDQRRIVCFTGSERGTSGRCPECGHQQRPAGRWWSCHRCPFEGHRDLVGSASMHPLAFGNRIGFPTHITYLRPGDTHQVEQASENTAPDVGSSSRPDTGRRESRENHRQPDSSVPLARTDVVLVEPTPPPPASSRVPHGTGDHVGLRPGSSSRSRD